MKKNQAAIIQAFVNLGNALNAWLSNENSCSELNHAIEKAVAQNEWFTKQNIRKMLASIATQMLDEKKLNGWISKYNFFAVAPKRVGIIAAGNLPLVFFHDFLCVLVSGNIAVVKLSSKDKILPTCIFDMLFEIEPQLKKYIEISETKTLAIDAVIATGSDNTNKFFEAEFGNIPHIFRNSRTSAALIKGNETPEQLELLGADMFSYFGLGCRNVSKLFVPNGYDFGELISAVSKYSYIKKHLPYANAYKYNKALLLMNETKFFDNDFWLLTENSAFFSPVSVINFEKYSNLEAAKKEIDTNKEHIQCVVNNDVAFGVAQQPRLTDYADGIDVMKFISSL